MSVTTEPIIRIIFAHTQRNMSLTRACHFCDAPTTRELVWQINKPPAILIPGEPLDQRTMGFHCCDRCFDGVQKHEGARRVTGAVGDPTISFEHGSQVKEGLCFFCTEPTVEAILWQTVERQREGKFGFQGTLCDARCWQAIGIARSKGRELIASLQ
jgi:hypothetical protein